MSFVVYQNNQINNYMKILSSCPTDCAYHSREIARAIATYSSLNGSDSVVAAELVQQVHYWMGKQQGIIVDGVRWIYNSYKKWIETQFPTISTYCFRKIKNALCDLGILLVDPLKKTQWNQTYYYTLNYERIEKLLDWKEAGKQRGRGAEEQRSEYQQLSPQLPCSPAPLLGERSELKVLKQSNVRSTNNRKCVPETIECSTVEPSNTKNTANKNITKKDSLCRLLEKLPEQERDKFLKFALNKAQCLPTVPELPRAWVCSRFDELLCLWKDSDGGVVQNLTKKRREFLEWYGYMKAAGNVIGERIENGVQLVQKNDRTWRSYERLSQSWTLEYLRKTYGGKR